MASKKPMMQYEDFARLYHFDPMRFWGLFEKTCGCEWGDVRYDRGIICCGKCDRKLKKR